MKESETFLKTVNEPDFLNHEAFEDVPVYSAKYDILSRLRGFDKQSKNSVLGVVQKIKDIDILRFNV